MTDDLSSDPLLRPEQGGVEIYLIRHGHAVPDVQEIVAGNYDEQSLSKRGQQQAQAMAARFRTIPLAAIYSSPILRARQTAQYIAEVSNQAIMLDADLREVDLSGVRVALLAESDPAERVAQLTTYLREIEALALRIGIWSNIPGVEPSEAVRRRMGAALARIATRHVGQRVAVVSHSGAINAVIAAFLGLQRDFFFPAANTSISTVRLLGDQRLVLTINDHAHLAQIEASGS